MSNTNTINETAARQINVYVTRNGRLNSTGMTTKSIGKNDAGASGVPNTSIAATPANKATS